VAFYINLRGRFISDYRDFIRVLFKIERGENLTKMCLNFLRSTLQRPITAGKCQLHDCVAPSVSVDLIGEEWIKYPYSNRI